MHTIQFGDNAALNHNSDWSGDVIISWEEGGFRKEVTMPGKVFLGLAKRSCFDLVGVVESAIDDWIERTEREKKRPRPGGNRDEGRGTTHRVLIDKATLIYGRHKSRSA